MAWTAISLAIIVEAFGRVSPIDSVNYHEIDVAGYSSDCFGRQACSPSDCQLSGPYQEQTTSYMKCNCHIDCYYYGTCCLNFEEICLTNEALSSLKPCHNLSTLAAFGRKDTSLSRSDFDAVMSLREERKLFKVVRDKRGYYNMVHKCPPCSGSSSDVIARCEGSLSSLEQVVAVVSNEVMYRNIFCYHCHMSDASLVDKPSPLSIQLECDESVRSDVYKSYEDGEIKAILDLINNGTCTVHYPEIANVSNVHSFTAYKQVCEPNDGSIQNYDKISAACSSYTAVMKYTGKWLSAVKNVHCALCNGLPVSVGEPSQCMCQSIKSRDGNCSVVQGDRFGVYFYAPILNVAVNFLQEPSLEPAGVRVCDEATEEVSLIKWDCEERSCKKGFIDVGKKCLHSDHAYVSSSSAVRGGNVGKANMCAYFSFDSAFGEVSSTFSETFLDLAFREFPERDQYSPVFGESNQNDCRTSIQQSEHSIKMISKTANLHPNILLWNFINRYATIMPRMQSELGISRLDLSFGSEEPCKPPFYKKNLTQVGFTWHGDPGLIVEETIKKLPIFSRLYSRKYGFTQNPISQNWILRIYKSDKSSVWEHRLIWQVCMWVDESCLTSPINRNCSVSEKLVHTPRKSGAQTGLAIMSVVHIFLCTLSIICLFAVVALHTLLPGIRNDSGFHFMALLTSIIGAEVCMILSSLRIWTRALCAFFAALQHLTWLASFSWSAVMSWNLLYAFVICKGVQKSNYYTGSNIIGWGFPIVIVAVCSGLHFAGRFQYGNETVCWISDAMHLALSFGVPVGGVIIFNMVVYIFIVCSLNKRLQVSKELGVEVGWKSRMLLYVKLSSVVGFTWIFGFLANIPGMNFFQYIFLVSAGLNGVFVALSFTLSSRSIRAIKTAMSTANFN